MIEKFKKMDNSKKVPIVITTAVVLIVIIILFAFNNKKTINYKIEKENNNEEIVYTVNTYENGIFHKYTPYINIKGSIITSINEDINSFVEDFADQDMVIISYEYNVNGKVLSLALKAVDYNTLDVPKAYFRTYNVNLETKELVSDAELLNSYNVTVTDVNKAIERQFANWYKDEIKESYLDADECDYECFLEYREVDDYMDNISYYVDNGKLIVFKPFSFYSVFNEEDYFKEEDFKFVISN